MTCLSGRDYILAPVYVLPLPLWPLPLCRPPRIGLTQDMLRLRAGRVLPQTRPTDAQAPVPAAALLVQRRCRRVVTGTRAAAGTTMASSWRWRQRRKRRGRRRSRRGAPLHHHSYAWLFAGPPPAASPRGRPRRSTGAVDVDTTTATAVVVRGALRWTAAGPATAGGSAACRTVAHRWFWRRRLGRRGRRWARCGGHHPPAPHPATVAATGGEAERPSPRCRWRQRQR